MIIDISIAVAVLIFAILTAFIIKTLITLTKTMTAIESRMNEFDSTLRSLSNIGDILETETEKLKYKISERETEASSNKLDLANAIAEWLIMSISIGKKFIQRRKI